MLMKTKLAQLRHATLEQHCSDTPVELHGLDVEAKCRADCGDIFVVQTLDNGCLPSVIQATGKHRLSVYGHITVNIATDCQLYHHDPIHLHHQKSHLFFLLFNLFYDG